MASNYVRGGSPVRFTAGADLTRNTPLIVGDMMLIVAGDTPSGEEAVGHVEGVFSGLPKASADVVTELAYAYWDAGNSEFTVSAAAGANKLVGHFAAAAGAGVTTCSVRLQPT